MREFGKIRRFLTTLCLSFVILCGISCQARAASVHSDFDHFTVALTWLPGFCDVAQNCKASQHRDVMIGLHGIWPSEPDAFTSAGIPEKMWIRRGCRSVARETWATLKPLSTETRHSYEAVIAETGSKLIDHEVKKHLACTSLDPDDTIRTALAVRSAFADSAAGLWLHDRAGHVVDRQAFFKVVQQIWPGMPRGGLILRCRRDAKHRATLVALELGMDRDEIATFPKVGAFTLVPGRRSSCPAKFWLPSWTR